MSTRAIIALPIDGGYETAWNWNDGSPSSLGTELRRYFKTEEQVRELIKEHSFSIICGKKDKDDLIQNYGTAEEEFKKLSNNRYILQHNRDGGVVEGGENGFIKTINEMLKYDLNYVYVFENGKWKTYK